MVRGLKLHDRVKGKEIGERNFVGVIIEVERRLLQKIFRVKWDGGQTRNYLASQLEIMILPLEIGGENIPVGGALAELDAVGAPDGARRQNLIAYNHEYDDSDVPSNYGSS